MRVNVREPLGWELFWTGFGQISEILVTHINWKIVYRTLWIKLETIFVLHELPKTVVVWALLITAATYEV